MIHIYTGDGKGKTTAAIGLVTRAKGAGMSCTLVHFFKTPSSSEDKALLKLGVDVVSVPLRHPFFVGNDFFQEKKDEYVREMQTILFDWDFSKYAVIALDEILNALDLGLINATDIKQFAEKYKDKEVVLTGRTNKLSEIELLADYITEMKKIKHPFDKGAGAREGIEF